MRVALLLQRTQFGLSVKIRLITEYTGPMKKFPKWQYHLSYRGYKSFPLENCRWGCPTEKNSCCSKNSGCTTWKFRKILIKQTASKWDCLWFQSAWLTLQLRKTRSYLKNVRKEKDARTFMRMKPGADEKSVDLQT